MEIVANVNCYKTVNSRVQTVRKIFYLNSNVSAKHCSTS